MRQPAEQPTDRRRPNAWFGSQLGLKPPRCPMEVAAIDWQTWVPRDRATLIFVVHEGEVLLIRKKRGLGAGKITAPGGRLEDEETPLECALRELHEELRVTATSAEAAGELRFQFVDGHSIHVWAFRALGFSGTAAETEEAVPLWTPLDSLPWDEMWADDRLWVPLLLEGRRFDGRFVFDGDRMLDHVVEQEGQTRRR
jgi:8-oxo-dGTP diphosphatase